MAYARVYLCISERVDRLVQVLIGGAHTCNHDGV